MYKPWESGCFEVLCNSMEEEDIFEDDKSPYEIVDGEIRWQKSYFIKDENGELKLCPELSEMESFDIPSEATRISDGFFANFKNLKSVTISREVTSIGKGVFDGCERLKSVEIPAGLNSALNAYPSIESVKYNDHGEISKITRTCRNNGWYEYMIYPSDELLYSWSEIIPSADYMAETDLSPVTSVYVQTKENGWESRLDAFKSGGECFSRTEELTQKEEKCLYIGGGSKALNKKVFINWYNNCSYIAIMTQQIIGYEKIYEYAERIFKIRPEMHSYVTDFVIKDDVLEKYIGNGENISIPYNVDHIGEYAFFCCDTLLSVAIPKGVITIGTGAFFGCENLKSVAVPNTVTSIGALAFFGCKNLSGVTVPGSVAAINSWAFSGCGSLTEVKIPESVAYIGDEAFRGCGKLGSLTILNRGVTIGSHAFDACKALKNVVIPPCAKEIFLKYKSVKSITCLEDDPQGMPSDCTRQKMISALSYYRAENRQIGVYGIKLLEGPFKDEPEVKFISYCLVLKGMRQFVGTPDPDQEGAALYKIQILANSGYARARTFLDIYCEKRYQKYIKSLPANDDDCGPLVDFDGKPIKIDRSGASLPIKAVLESGFWGSRLTLSPVVSFSYLNDDEIKSHKKFEKAVIDGILAWQGEYTVFGGQKLSVRVNITNDNTKLFNCVSVMPVTSGTKSVMRTGSKLASEENRENLYEDLANNRSMMSSFTKWSVKSNKYIYIMSKSGRFDEYEEIKHAAKHEFGHALGLSDLYAEEERGQNGVKAGSYPELDCYATYANCYNLVMCDHHGPISNNDIEMVVLAFRDNKGQAYQPQKGFGKGVSTALGKGN